MIFRQLFERETSTYTYLIGDAATGDALLIDPVLEETAKYTQLLRELGLTLRYALDTHVHADHVTALGALRDATGCVTLMGAESKAACVSRTLRDGEVLQMGEVVLKALHTPGHTDDSYCFLVGDMLFSGDTLLIRGSGRTDFQHGNAADQYDSIFGKLLTLPASTWVYPGHDYKGYTVSTVAEERAHNPRLQVPDREAYIALMGALKLPNPKLMDIAVPANLACGKVAG